MRRPTNLSESLHHRLNSYALAASATGVGMLALAQPAEGKIVYTPVREHLGPHQVLALDPNHDGRTEFTIVNTMRRGTDSYSYILSQRATQGDGAACSKGHGGPGYALALKRGSQVGSGRRFCQGDGLEYVFGSRSHFYFGDWKNVDDRYLGLEFKIEGQTHYGWARMGVNFRNGLRAVLTGYAYETVPNKPIIAGKTHGKDVVTVQPASLGHLARGASAIPAWRAKESK